MKTLVNAVVRQGRTVIKSANITKDQAIMLMTGLPGKLDDAAFIMVSLAELRKGKPVKFKRDGLGVTLEPLHNHIDNY